jgi:hypothetical protein
MAEDRSPLSQVGRSDPKSRSALDPVAREHLEIEQLLFELDGLRWELATPSSPRRRSKPCGVCSTGCTRSSACIW